MKELIPQLKDFLALTKGNPLPDEEFFRFLDQNPPLYSLVSSALREGQVSEGNVLVNCPEALVEKNVSTQTFSENLTTLKTFSRWLQTAAKKYKLGLFESKPNTKKSATRKPRNTPSALKPENAIVRGTIDALEERLENLPALHRVAQTVGGLHKLRAMITAMYAQCHSQVQTAIALSKATQLPIDQKQVSKWMRQLLIPANPHTGGKKIVMKKSVRIADRILRRRVKFTLPEFIRNRHAAGKRQFQIRAEVKNLTGVDIYSATISKLYRRLRINVLKGGHG